VLQDFPADSHGKKMITHVQDNKAKLSEEKSLAQQIVWMQASYFNLPYSADERYVFRQKERELQLVDQAGKTLFEKAGQTKDLIIAQIGQGRIAPKDLRLLTSAQLNLLSQRPRILLLIDKQLLTIKDYADLSLEDLNLLNEEGVNKLMIGGVIELSTFKALPAAGKQNLSRFFQKATKNSDHLRSDSKLKQFLTREDPSVSPQ
jgi:hypothetical protein